MILYFLAGFLAIVLVWFVWWFPKRQTSKYNFEPDKRWQVENELRKTLIQVLGGLVVIGGLFLTFEQLKDSRNAFEQSRKDSRKEFEQSRDEFKKSQENVKAGQLSSRFSKAIELLSNGEDTTKIGGIYALEQIARESPENYLGTVIEVLSAFVRNADVIPEKMDFGTWKIEIAPHDQKVKAWYKSFNKKYPERTNEAVESEVNALKTFYNEWKEKNYKIKPETQIAMTVLGRIRKEENKPYWVNLPRINLSDVKLANANLWGANLREADLQGANLWLADLNFTNLQEAFLQGADLIVADFRGAILFEADLTEAKYLTTEQLLKVKTLYKVKGLPPEMEKELKEKKPELFKLKISFPIDVKHPGQSPAWR